MRSLGGGVSGPGMGRKDQGRHSEDFSGQRFGCETLRSIPFGWGNGERRNQNIIFFLFFFPEYNFYQHKILNTEQKAGLSLVSRQPWGKRIKEYVQFGTYSSLPAMPPAAEIKRGGEELPITGLTDEN